MSHYWIFGIGMFVGTFLGLLIAGLLGAAHQGEVDREIYEAWEAGYKVGTASPGQTFEDWHGWPG